MTFALRACFWLLLALPLAAQDAVRFRIWLGGETAGEATRTRRREGSIEVVEQVQHLSLARLGMEVRQSLSETARRHPDGTEAYSWNLQLSAVPMTGTATRAPGAADFTVHPGGGTPKSVPLPKGALLWPEAIAAKLQAQAQARQPISLESFAFATQQWNRLELACEGPDALPGFADAVRFKGTLRQGALSMPVTSWISPTAGEVKQVSSFGGIELIQQREELPVPSTPSDGRSFFDQTLQSLPPHPLLTWLPSVDLTWSGAPAPSIPEDRQQAWTKPGLLRVRKTPALTEAERLEAPVRGASSAEDRPWLAATPLVAHQHPCFEGLVARMAPKAGASRWELAQAVTHTVFDWITRKDMSVGFAGAVEVCQNGRGDCTEHGILAIALLRRLGVPARGAMGWVGLDTLMGLHFWVEVKLAGRWVPIDPTFDQAPASALRILLATTDVADLGSLGWDQATGAFRSGRWQPSPDWLKPLSVRGTELLYAGKKLLRLDGAAWRLDAGTLSVRWQKATLRVQAVTRPSEAQLEGFRLFQQRHRGRHHAGMQCLYVELPGSCWMRVEEVTEAQALALLAHLEFFPDAL